jgi:hypothetical protein
MDHSRDALGANPFTYGNPISDPERFIGRRREVDQVFSRLRNAEAESSSLVGERRVGKTSLLAYLAHPLPPDRRSGRVLGLLPSVFASSGAAVPSSKGLRPACGSSQTIHAQLGAPTHDRWPVQR